MLLCLLGVQWSLDRCAQTLADDLVCETRVVTPLPVARFEKQTLDAASRTCFPLECCSECFNRIPSRRPQPHIFLNPLNIRVFCRVIRHLSEGMKQRPQSGVTEHGTCPQRSHESGVRGQWCTTSGCLHSQFRKGPHCVRFPSFVCVVMFVTLKMLVGEISIKSIFPRRVEGKRQAALTLWCLVLLFFGLLFFWSLAMASNSLSYPLIATGSTVQEVDI